MEDRPLIIIGAGFAGLSAGIYAQMNGYQTQIFEMHDLTTAFAPPGRGILYQWAATGWLPTGINFIRLSPLLKVVA
jgi:2-polyprenyl-6-methoxyphenol hydroxylase-like FAD-dependent oxidoreductase